MQVSVSIKRCLISTLLLLGILAPSSVSSDAPGRKTTDPAGVVNEFCRFDFDGVRLNSLNPHWKEYKNLVQGDGDWPEEPVTIIAGFRVTSTRQKKDTATVEVEYDVQGTLEGALESDRIFDDHRSEAVTFPLSRAKRSWKIKPFELPPHVSVDAMRDHIRDIMRDDEKEGNSRRRDVLQRLLARLDTLGK